MAEVVMQIFDAEDPVTKDLALHTGAGYPAKPVRWRRVCESKKLWCYDERGPGALLEAFPGEPSGAVEQKVGPKKPVPAGAQPRRVRAVPRYFTSSPRVAKVEAMFAVGAIANALVVPEILAALKSISRPPTTGPYCQL